MKPHEERVLSELKELADRREKLGTFIGTNPLFNKLGVLQERIDHFPV